MNRNWESLAVVALAAACFLASAAKAEDPCGTAGHAAAAPGKPNIILILTDDQDQLLNSLDVMPNLKSLISDQGITFDNNLVPLSLCCPSRATILRGQFPHNHMIRGNSSPLGGFAKAYSLGIESATVATALHGAGYRTVLLGKYLNGYPDTAPDAYIPPGWDEWYSPAAGDPYSEYNYTLNENGTLVKYKQAATDYLTDVILSRAVSFITRSAQAPDQPIFMYFATYAPHQPATPAPRHANLFPGVQAPRRPSFNEADVSGKPSYIQDMPLLTDKDIQNIDALYRKRLQSLQAVDEAIAMLIQTLRATGRLDNSYIFFASDNGFHMGEHRLQSGKYTPYETDLHVPLMVRGPRVPAGVTYPYFTSEVDLAATWAELAGVPTAVATDGRSLVPLIRAAPPPSDSWRQAFLIEQYENGNPLLDPEYARAWKEGNAPGYLEPPDPQDVAQAAAAAAKPWPTHFGYDTWTYKYVEYGTGEKELYVLSSDPDELANQVERANQTIVASLSAYLATLKNCVAAGCSAADAVTPPALLTADYAYSPEHPTDLTPVTFTASAAGTPPYTYSWDLGGTPASGETATKTFEAGTYTVTLAVQDAITAQAAASKSVLIAPHITIDSVTKAQNPFRLIVRGTNFQPGCAVKINGAPAPNTAYKSPTQVNAKGAALSGMVPKGVAVQVTVLNPNGVESPPFSFTR